MKSTVWFLIGTHIIDFTACKLIFYNIVMTKYAECCFFMGVIMKNNQTLHYLVILIYTCIYSFNINASVNYQHLFEGKSILVTGGGGTLGSAVVKEILKYSPKSVTIFSRDETKHFKFLESLHYPANLKSVLGDIRDFQAVLRATEGVDIVIHAAALKRVDSIESNVEESIKTNVLGSMNIYNACVLNKIKKAVFVSTDKSCSPISAYGAGKFLGEKIFTNYDRAACQTVFSCVRFGNIIGSTGSIVPIFIEKIKNDEEIPLTDARMTRFMITREDAVQFIFDAIQYSVGGEIFVKQLPSIKIIDLIETMIEKLHSKSKIKIIGLRPGERTFESLLSDNELHHCYKYSDTYVIVPALKNWIDSFKNNDYPIYLKSGVALDTLFSKELNSDDFVISKEELEIIFDKLNILDESNKQVKREEWYEDFYL